MTELEPPTSDRRRSPSARIVWESCRRPDRFITFAAVMGVLWLVGVIAGQQGPHVDTGFEILSSICAALFLTQRSRRARIERLCREGERIDVTYRCAHHLNTRAYLCTRAVRPSYSTAAGARRGCP